MVIGVRMMMTSAITTNVYGRRSANATIHISKNQSFVDGPRAVRFQLQTFEDPLPTSGDQTDECAK